MAEGEHCCICPAGRQHGEYERSEGGWRGYESRGGLWDWKDVLIWKLPGLENGGDGCHALRL